MIVFVRPAGHVEVHEVVAEEAHAAVGEVFEAVVAQPLILVGAGADADGMPRVAGDDGAVLAAHINALRQAVALNVHRDQRAEPEPLFAQRGDELRGLAQARLVPFERAEDLVPALIEIYQSAAQGARVVTILPVRKSKSIPWHSPISGGARNHDS